MSSQSKQNDRASAKLTDSEVDVLRHVDTMTGDGVVVSEALLESRLLRGGTPDRPKGETIEKGPAGGGLDKEDIMYLLDMEGGGGLCFHSLYKNDEESKK